MEEALDLMWMWTPELFESDEVDSEAVTQGYGVDPSTLKEAWTQKITQVLGLATLQVPENPWGQTGGRNGNHTEHLGFLLAEMQYLPKSYPDAKW